MPSLKPVAGRACAAIAIAMTPALPLGAVDAAISVLERGKPVERRLSGGESHTYQITLHGGEGAALTLEQRGIDVSIRVSDATGTTIADFDDESRRQGRERAGIVPQEDATYQVTVSARYPRDPEGSYELRVDDIRRATGFRSRAGRSASSRGRRGAAPPVCQVQRRRRGSHARSAAGRTGTRRQRSLRRLAPHQARYRAAAGRGTRSGRNSPSGAHWRSATRRSAASTRRPRTPLSLLAALYAARDDYAKAEPMMRRPSASSSGRSARSIRASRPHSPTSADLHSYRGDFERARARARTRLRDRRADARSRRLRPHRARQQSRWRSTSASRSTTSPSRCSRARSTRSSGASAPTTSASRTR